jgi:hypothetical protein
MGWVKETFPDKGIHGIVISGKFDERLHYASSQIPNVDTLIYEVLFNLKPHEKNSSSV